MADDEQFSLCWNNFNTNLSAGFHESLCRGDLVDVTLAAEGQLVKAHRLVLSVCSPYFRKMFTQMPANQHAFVFLKDVSHSALKDLIQFMYCGEVNVKQDALPAFISTAEALQIKGLTENGDGPSAPAPHPSPAKESTIVHSTPAAPHPVASSRVGQKIVQRGRVQSYKVESEESSDEKAQTVHVQPTPVAQKRTIARTITPSSTPVMKRAKITTTADPLEASEPTVQTIQIVKNVPSSEPEYVEMPIETINPKSEPEYVEDTAVIEGTDQEHDDTETHEIHETEEGQYVEDESYGDMKYDESYFTEGDDTKAGASGFGESYAEGADQSASEAQGNQFEIILKKQKDDIEILKRKNRRLESSIQNLDKINQQYKTVVENVHIKQEEPMEELSSSLPGTHFVPSADEDHSLLSYGAGTSDDRNCHVFKKFSSIPKRLNGQPLKEPILSYEVLVAINYECNPDINGDRFFVNNVLRALYDEDTLAYSSLTGQPTKRHKNSEPKSKLDVEVIRFIYDRFLERIAAIATSQDDRDRRSKKSLFNRYIAKTCYMAFKKKSLNANVNNVI